MRKFDTKVQHLKYQVLREVARHAFDDTLVESFNDIAKVIVKDKPTMRCCIYKERAIVGERIKLATGGDKTNPNVIEVIDIACEECPMGGFSVTDACRGCVAHRCEDVCKRGAISFDSEQKAHIDKDKCIECGKCAEVCPYGAILNFTRPCVRACKIKAISVSDNKAALIDNDKCISCGACVYQCPFGAICDKSYILEVIDFIKESQKNNDVNLYAVVAPSIASQFTYAKIGQVISGIKELGFHKVVEAALGADMVALSEGRELVEKGKLTSSCCPAFVSYIRKSFPDLEEYISSNLSPMATISKYIKDNDPNAKVVFIGPCTAKKSEIRTPEVREYVDSAITFEELQALFDAKEIEITTLGESSLDDASYYGRIFARCGGLADAVQQSLKEQKLDENFTLNGLSCDGIEECRAALLRLNKGVLPNNFIEGMACVGGCVGGAGCLTHTIKNKIITENYGKEAVAQSITEAIKPLEDGSILNE